MGIVLLVRHGQASFGAEDYDVLSEIGVAQSKRLGAWLAEAGVEPSALIHGAMRRQRDTATAMVDDAGWSVVPALDEGWNEFDHLGVVARGFPPTAGMPTVAPSRRRSSRPPPGGPAASTTTSTTSRGRRSWRAPRPVSNGPAPVTG